MMISSVLAATAVVTGVPPLVVLLILLAAIVCIVLLVAKLVAPAHLPGVSWVGLAIAAVILLIAWALLGGTT